MGLEHITALWERARRGVLESGCLSRYTRDGQLVVPGGLAAPEQVSFCCFAGDIARLLREHALSVSAFTQLVELELRHGETPAGLANSYARLGLARQSLGQIEPARSAFQEGARRLGGLEHPHFMFNYARFLSNQGEYREAGPRWQQAFTGFRHAGDIELAVQARGSMISDLLLMAQETFERGEDAIQSGATEEVLGELADRFAAVTLATRDMVDELFSAPDLAPHAFGRYHYRIELGQAFRAMGRHTEAIAQLKDALKAPGLEADGQAELFQLIADSEKRRAEG